MLGDRVPILASESDVAADKTIAEVQVLLPPPAVNDSWAQPGGSPSKSNGPARAGREPVAGVDRPDRRRLAAPAARRLRRWSPMADSMRWMSTALFMPLPPTPARRSGRTASSRPTATRAARFGGGVSFDDGKVYATDGLGDVVALNATTGAELWRAKPGAPAARCADGRERQCLCRSARTTSCSPCPRPTDRSPGHNRDRWKPRACSALPLPRRARERSSPAFRRAS